MILSVCGSSDVLVQAAHEPGETRQPVTKLIDPCGVRSDDIQINLLGLGLKAGRLVAWRIEQSPAQRDFLIAPVLCEVRAHPQNDVEMVAHHGIAADVDTEDSRELLKPQANPLLAVIVVLSGNRIVAAEERPPYASNDAVIKADAVIGHDFATRIGRHGRALAWQTLDDKTNTVIIVPVMDKSIKVAPVVKRLDSHFLKNGCLEL